MGIIKRDTARNEAASSNRLGTSQPLTHSAGARVTVELDWDSLDVGIQVNLVSAQPGSERQAAELLVWEQGAIYGVRFALKAANAMPCSVRITEMCGDAACTNPTVVAAASACAVWEALEIHPPFELVEIMAERVRESREQGRTWLGRFEL